MLYLAAGVVDVLTAAGPSAASKYYIRLTAATVLSYSLRCPTTRYTVTDGGRSEAIRKATSGVKKRLQASLVAERKKHARHNSSCMYSLQMVTTPKTQNLNCRAYRLALTNAFAMFISLLASEGV
jgi:hypothetical protein